MSIKCYFQGVPNDQIALSFRLAFAMATAGAANSKDSFIFLDEPLGFFDDERRNALINFLTHGSIGKIFASTLCYQQLSNDKTLL